MQIAKQGNNKIGGNDTKTYKANSRLLALEEVQNLDINKFLTKLAGQQISDSFGAESNQSEFESNSNQKPKIFLPLDGSELRKKWTSKSEKLDRVRDLEGGTINGYHSYSTIAVTENNHSVFLLENQVFSTKEEDFLSKNKIVLDLVDSTLESLSKLPNQKVFLMDREFDNQSIIEHLCYHQDKPNFIIRVKHLNRQVKEGKLNELKFPKAQLFKIKELQIKQKIHQDLTLKLTHRKVTLVDKNEEETGITIIKSKLLNKDKQPIFKNEAKNNKEEFCLLTNLEINNSEELYQIYLNYFVRWKIETVFKFLKEVLGMEEFRVQNLEKIKTLVALTFVVGSYFNQLGQIPISDEFLAWLCKLGGGGKKVTKFYAKQGLQVLINYVQVEMFFKQENIPKDKQEALLNLVRF
jgi:hypothetical protein